MRLELIMMKMSMQFRVYHYLNLIHRDSAPVNRTELSRFTIFRTNLRYSNCSVPFNSKQVCPPLLCMNVVSNELCSSFSINHACFQALICLMDKKTGEKSKTRPRFVKQDQVAIMRIECAGVICLEQFKLFPQMGRFTLRDEGNIFSTIQG